MYRPRQRRLAVVSAAVACAAALLFYCMRPHNGTGTALRAGIRNHSLAASLNPEGRVDALAVAVLDAAARRAGMRIEWVECPEGPDAALRSKKVDLWPIALDLPARKKLFHITEPWLAAERCLVTKGLPPARWEGARVTYGMGVESELLKAAPGATPVHAEGDLAAVRAVCADEARAAYVLVQSLGAFVLRKPDGCESANFHVTPVSGEPLKLGIGSTFEAAPAARKLRMEIGRMAAQGALDDLYDKYSFYSVAGTSEIYQLLDAERRTQALAYGAAGLALALAILAWQVRRVREARRLAEQANRAKSEFLANVSHEIRTPINGIVGMTEVLGRSALTAEQREVVSVILSSSESLMTVVNDILDFSTIESGGMILEPARFEIRPAVEDAVRMFAPRAQRKGLKLECRITSDVPPSILGDPRRIRQILMNLLSNAVKFTASGRIAVEVERAGSPAQAPALVFRVADTGIGIPPEMSRRLFRAFTQADSAARRKFGGTGLGLAIAHRLASLMDGSIGFESQPGKGSVFWFVIPAPDGEPAAPAASVPDAEPESAGRRILIVEDNPVNQLVAQRALRALGYASHVAPSGEAALDVLGSRGFDLILMDCQMPGMDGYETAAEIRRRENGSRRTPIVAMTANAVDGDRERCAAAGMDDYLTKPFRMAALEGALQRWLTPTAESSVA